VQRQASELYKGVKALPLKKYSQKFLIDQVRKKGELPKGVLIGAEDVPNYWFEKIEEFKNWWQIGEWVVKFSNVYPEIPIIVKTQDNEITTKGAIGSYDGSEYQEFTELLRKEFNNDSDAPIFIGTPAYKKGSKYTHATWGTYAEKDVEIPKVPPPTIEIDGGKKQVIIEREEEEDEREREKKRLKRKKKPLPKKKKPVIKKPKKKVPKKVKPKKKPTTEKVVEIRSLISDLRQDVKDGLITKKDYQEMVKALVKNMKKGGKV